MTLASENNILIQEIQSWQGFGEILRKEDRKLFQQMLTECHQLSEAIIAKGELYSTESLLMGLVFLQQKMINQLLQNNQMISAAKNKAENSVESIE